MPTRPTSNTTQTQQNTGDCPTVSGGALIHTHVDAARRMFVSLPSPPSLGLNTLLTSVVYETCTAGCRSFLWRGTGEPTFDDDGRCSCSCDGDTSWSDVNMLGHPSCVPVPAYVTFGLAGLFISVAGTFHAGFHLHRQVSSQVPGLRIP